jgi:ABC-type multidrug transport system fused ATPase/permease subunit
MKRSHRPVRILAPYLTKESKALGIAALATILVTAAQLAGPVPLALVVDRLFEKSRGPGGFELTTADLWLLAGVAGLVIGISLVTAFASYLSDISLARAGERIVHELRVATHIHLQRLSLRFHSRRHTGDLVTRLTGDVNAVGALFSESLGTVASAVLLLAGMIVVSALIDPVLALVAFAVTPLLAFTTFYARKRLKLASRQARTREGEIASLTAESFAAIREVKAFGSEPYEHKRLSRKSEERLRAGYDASRIESRFARVTELIGAVGVASVLVVGVVRVARGAVTPGELVIMYSYTRKTQRPLRDIARQAGRIARSMARAERITEILATDDMLEDRPGAHDGPPARGELELESVSFSYEPDRRALENVSLRVEAGTKLALLGRSGAGKSTVAALVARFYDPASGRVCLDGRDLRDCSLAWIRRQVGLVLQDTVLFSGTVAENIAYGIDARQEEIEATAKAAGAHGFISQLPEGYQTALGPRGIGLSGGQRQRIAIARTLLRDPAILVLDEPTTGLDAESEAQVLDGLSSLMRGRTTIIISHSPRLLESADRSVSIENGRLVRDERRDAELADLGKSLLRRFAAKLHAPAEPSRRAPVPADAALPRLPTLLDPDAMAPFLHRSLGPDAPFPDVRVHYLRYKPGTNIVVRYDVGLDGGWFDASAMIKARPFLDRRATNPQNVALARLVDGRSPAPMPLHYAPELDALIQWFPLDLELPALAEPPERLLEELAAAGAPIEGTDGDVSTLAYKPRRRAVLRVGEHVLKIYAKEEEFACAAAGLRASGAVRDVRTPRMQGALPGRLVTLQSLIRGSRPSQPGDIALEAGALLRELHSSPVPGLASESRPRMLSTAESSAKRVVAMLPVLRGRLGELLPDPNEAEDLVLAAAEPRHQLSSAAASAQLVAAIRPDLQPRVQRLLAELEDTAPPVDGLVPSHGDFNARQLLVTQDRVGVAVVDFDAMCLAPAALDLATYAGYVVLGGNDDLDEAYDLLEELLDGYGADPLGLSWYLATCILRRSPRPFRYLDEHWPERVEGMVLAAETVVGR